MQPVLRTLALSMVFFAAILLCHATPGHTAPKHWEVKSVYLYKGSNSVTLVPNVNAAIVIPRAIYFNGVHVGHGMIFMNGMRMLVDAGSNRDKFKDKAVNTIKIELNNGRTTVRNVYLDFSLCTHPIHPYEFK